MISKLITKEGYFLKEYEDGEAEFIKEAEFNRIKEDWMKLPNIRTQIKNGATILINTY